MILSIALPAECGLASGLSGADRCESLELEGAGKAQKACPTGRRAASEKACPSDKRLAFQDPMQIGVPTKTMDE